MRHKTSRTGWHIGFWGAVAAIFACGGVGGCSEGPEGMEGVAVVAQALDPSAKAPLQLSFQLRDATALTDVVIAARDFVRLADRVELAATTNVTNGRIEAGVDAKVGSLTAHGEVRIGARTRVTGNVRAGGAVVRDSSAVVTGTINQNLGSRPLTTIAWTVQAPVNSQGPVSLEPDQTRDLAPARYGALSVKARSTLTLHTGVYRFSSIAIESQGKLRLDDRNGPVQIVVDGQFTFRGAVTSVGQSIPRALFALQGTQDAFVESPFVGAIVAPNATVRLQAALPEGHRAMVVGKSVWLEPDTKILRVPFDWGTVVGPSVDPMPANTPIHVMKEGGDALTVSIPAVGGTTTTASTTTSTAVRFTLPTEYTVSGGIIGNGTAIFRAGTVTCTYRGQSSTAQPQTPDELIKGTLLKFVSCSDGLPASAQRTGTQFQLTVNPIPNYGVTVQPPYQRPDVCSDTMEILTPAQTRAMRQGFNWSSATKVAADNPDGTPTLYYAWIHIRNKAEALALKKLFIHVLNRPLFDEELMQYAGKCGSFTNPGDGEGTFVPALIPGRTYNKLIDALTSPDVTGDRVIFDAVILRTVPAAARNANGSVNLRPLAQSGFRYLGYEVNPFAPDNEIVLEGGASKFLTDSLAWVGQAARDAGEIVTSALAFVDQLIRGKVEVNLFVHAITDDSLFRGSVMRRAWGTFAEQPMGANGMQVTILQKLLGTPIPTTSQGDTDINGHVAIIATDGAEIRGTGLCIEMRTDAAIVTDFLIATEMCDLRGFDALTSPMGPVTEFRLDTLNSDKTLELHIDSKRLLGLYQSHDVFRYSQDVMGYTPKRARILSGFWATTIAPMNEKGVSRLFTPCLNFPNTLTETLTAAAAAGGAAVGAVVGSVLPGIGTGAGALVGAAALSVFASVVGNSDIVMSTHSKIRSSRGVMSHEYGHYMFCNMIYDANGTAIDHVIWATAIRGDVVDRFPLRYLNEAVADFYAGQVAGLADYKWLLEREENDVSEHYCSSRKTPCWDANLRRRDDEQVDEFDHPAIARVATLLLDVFDGQLVNGQKAPRMANVPTNADPWRFDNVTSRLVFDANPNGDNDDDTRLERVALPGPAMRRFAALLASTMGPFIKYNFGDAQFSSAGFVINNQKILNAANGVMAENNVSWCDRCRVLALHQPGANDTNVRTLWETCMGSTELQTALGPVPDPSLRLRADTCQVCPNGSTSNNDGVCVACPNTVVGNTCQVCTTDVVIDGNTEPLGLRNIALNQTAAGDNCPNELVVEVRNPGALFTRGAVELGALLQPSPANQATCQRSFSLTTTLASGAASTLARTGSWRICPDAGTICVNPCENLPFREVTPAEAGGGSVFFRAPSLPNAEMSVKFGITPGLPE